MGGLELRLWVKIAALGFVLKLCLANTAIEIPKAAVGTRYETVGP